jgi:hypothetical protein
VPDFSMPFRTSRLSPSNSRRTIGVLVVAALAAASLAGCSSDSSKSSDVVVTEVAAAASEPVESTALDPKAESTEAESNEAESTEPESTEAPQTELAAPATDTEATETAESAAAPNEAAAGSLAADSATCKAFAKVKELNDRGGVLTSEFQTRLVEAIGESPDKAAKEWETFQKKFAADSEIVLPQLKDAYATLAKEQPTYAKDFTNLNDVTADLITFLTTISYDDLDQMETKMAEVVPPEKTIAAGQSSLKIDVFSKESCGIAFANT